MRITKKIVTGLVADGITSKSKVADIKEALGNEELTKDDIAAIREAVGAVEEPSELSPEEAMVSAKRALKEMKAEDPKRYGHVVDVVEASPAGRPIRVTIKCTDPQVDGEGTNVCEKTREVAIQDAFQSLRCEACQGRKTQIYRNDLARLRRARHRDLEAGKSPKRRPKKAKVKA